jgi:hypothetical protein
MVVELLAAAVVVKSTVAMPLLEVVLVEVANEPPDPLLLQVTTRPEIETTLLFTSTSWAVIVTASPATGA